MREYIAQHKIALKAEVDLRRRRARIALDRCASSATPVTREPWVQWPHRHEDFFYQKMQAAGPDRRQMNRRLQAADNNLPPPVRRLSVMRPPVRVSALPEWKRILWGRSGWFVVRPAAAGGARMLFLYVFQKRTYSVDISQWRQGKEHILGDSSDFRIDRLVTPLEEVNIAGAAKVAEAFVSAAVAPGGVRLSAQHARPLVEPLPKTRRQRKRRRDQTGEEDARESASASSAATSQSGALIRMTADARGSSSASSAPSVDTALDEELADAPPLAAIGKAGLGIPDPEGSNVAGDSGFGPAPEVASASEDDGEAADDEDEDTCRRRHPPGIWNVWENPWFYITKTPGFTDLKCWVKWSFRSVSTGMGGVDDVEDDLPSSLQRRVGQPLAVAPHSSRMGHLACEAWRLGCAKGVAHARGPRAAPAPRSGLADSAYRATLAALVGL